MNDYFPCEIASAVAATRQKWEGTDPAWNLCLTKVPGIPIPDDEYLSTSTDVNDAITDGITPVILSEGAMKIARSVTMAANASSFRVIDTHKVTVSDFLADDIQIKMASRYKGFKLSPDTGKPLPSKVTTPSRIKAALMEWLRVHEKAGRITRVTELSDEVRVEMDEEVPGRVNFEIPEDVIEIFAVGAGNIIQVG
jgi:phage tail sheath gpL-like